MHGENVTFLCKVLRQFYPDCSVIPAALDQLLCQQWLNPQHVGAASRCSAVGSEARAPSPSKVDEIGPFQPQLTMGIFGAFVSNDRAAVRAEKGKEWVNFASCQHYYGEKLRQRNSFFDV